MQNTMCDKIVKRIKRSAALLLLTVILLILIPVGNAFAQAGTAIVTSATQWKYLDRNEDPSPGANRLAWTYPDYNDSAWNTGSGGFGAKKGSLKSFTGEYPANVLLEQYDAKGNSQAAYFFRTRFTLDSLDGIESLRGTISYDDAAVVYLNGKQVYSGCVPSGGYTQNLEYGSQSDGAIQTDELMLPADVLHLGENVLAVEVHQASSSSSDVYFSLPELVLSAEPFVLETLDTTGLIIEVGAEAGNVQFSWMTDESGAFTLWLAPKNRILNGKFPADSYRTTLSQTADGIYWAQAYGLSENTDYAYCIMSDLGIACSKTYSFHMPSRDVYTFLFLGDPQIRSYEAAGDGAMWANTMDNALEMYPEAAFMTVAGDLGDVAKEAEYMAFRSPVSLKSVPVAPNRGNHDAKANYYDEQFSEPNANGCSYYFTYGDVLVVALDSNVFRYEAHREFLRSAIERENKRWVIVTMHHSIFSVGEHATGSTVKSMRPEYTAMFKDLDVDLVLSGHDHRYCRSYIMDGDEPTGKSVGIKNNGETLYISSGSASGTKYYDLASRVDSFDYVAYYLQTKEPVYTAVHVTHDRLFIVTHGAEGVDIIDTCVIEKQ